ncbi:type 1 fimbrial protein [Salmonella enterica]|nr:type 1 fimbrial protein [Salmonella enterica]
MAGQMSLFFQRNGIKLSVFTLFTRAAWRAVFVPLCMTVLVMPEMADAAITGTQTFKADITTGTCTVPGSQMTQTIDFGDIPKLKVLSGSDTGAVTVGVPVVSRNIHFNVTGCPDGISLIGLEVGFTPWSVAHQSWIKNSGSAGGVAMVITDSGGGVMTPGDLPQNGSVTIEGVVHVYRVAEKRRVTPGGDKRRGDSGVVFSVSPPEWKRIAGGNI